MIVIQKQKMQAVVEAAGECWHEFPVNHGCFAAPCSKCHGSKHSNPPPTDLNELFRLAEKLDIDEIRTDFLCFCEVIRWYDNTRFCCADATTPAEALLNALYESVNETGV